MYGASSIPSHIDLENENVDDIMIGAWKRWARGPKRMLLTVVAALALSGLLVACQVLVMQRIGPLSTLMDVLLTIGWMIAALVFIEFAVRRFGFPPCLYAELRDRGHDLCLRCGYDLTSHPGDEITCPECGRAGHRRPVGRDAAAQPPS